MAIILDRVDAVPLNADDFSFEFKAWLSVLVDSLNAMIQQLEDAIVSTNTITGTTQEGEVNSSYIPLNAALTVIQLPDFMEVGAIVQVVGFGAGGWRILTGSGQTIHIVAGTANTSVSSSNRYDSITIKCVVKNTTWVSISSQTAGFVLV